MKLLIENFKNFLSERSMAVPPGFKKLLYSGPNYPPSEYPQGEMVSLNDIVKQIKGVPKGDHYVLQDNAWIDAKSVPEIQKALEPQQQQEWPPEIDVSGLSESKYGYVVFTMDSPDLWGLYQNYRDIPYDRVYTILRLKDFIREITRPGNFEIEGRDLRNNMIVSLVKSPPGPWTPLSQSPEIKKYVKNYKKYRDEIGDENPLYPIVTDEDVAAYETQKAEREKAYAAAVAEKERGERRTHAFKKYSDPEGEMARSREEIEIDRAAKRKWNQEADHEFFNEEVQKIHWVGAFGQKLPEPEEIYKTEKEQRAAYERGGYDEATRMTTPALDRLKTLDFSRQKNEISLVGYLEEPSSYVLSDLGFEVDGYVTLASEQDAGTEWTSLATPEDIEKHKASGLPKRPSVSLGKHSAMAKHIAPEAFMKGREDWVEPKRPHRHDWDKAATPYNELIVDNWKISKIIIPLGEDYWRYQRKEKREKEIQGIIDYAATKGVPVFDADNNRLSPEETLKESFAKFMRAWLRG